MALTPDSKLKLAAGVYGDFVTNEEVDNPTDRKFGYKPNLGSHEVWINNLLSGDEVKIKSALTGADIVDTGQQTDVIAALPTERTEREIALAVYRRLRHDFAINRPAPAAGSASSHDY